MSLRNTRAQFCCYVLACQFSKSRICFNKVIDPALVLLANELAEHGDRIKHLRQPPTAVVVFEYFRQIIPGDKVILQKLHDRGKADSQSVETNFIPATPIAQRRKVGKPSRRPVLNLARGPGSVCRAEHDALIKRYFNATSLVKAIARASRWYEQIISGEVQSFEQIANEIGTTPTYVSRIFRFASLSPAIVQSILAGSPASTPLLRTPSEVPLDWREQRSQWVEESGPMPTQQT
jgi:hypothetical protein